MLALYVDWRGRPADPRMMRRVAASLGLGESGSAQLHSLAPGVFAAVAKPAERVDTRGGVALLFHGWIQNRAELRAALGIGSASDAALYAAAWERWAERAEERMVGEYAAILVELGRSPRAACPRTDRGAAAARPSRGRASGRRLDCARDLCERCARRRGRRTKDRRQPLSQLRRSRARLVHRRHAAATRQRRTTRARSRANRANA